MEKLTIDNKLAFTPGRVISKTKIVYPDHYSLILKFTNIPVRPRKKVAGQKYSTWNTNKEGSWDKYKELTECNGKLDAIAEETIEDATSAMKNVSKELDKCKFQAFGKVSVKDTPVVNKKNG